MEFIKDSMQEGELRTSSRLHSIFLQFFGGYKLKDTTLRAVRNSGKSSLSRIYVLVKK